MSLRAAGDAGCHAGVARWTFLLVSVGGVMMTLDVTVVHVALAAISDDLHAGLPEAQLTVSAYSMAFGATLLTAGALSDRLGRRCVFLLGHVLFTVASAACAAAPGARMLIAARALQGLGGAMVFAPSLALLAGVCSGARRRQAIASYAVIASAAGALGPLLGGALIELGSWRWIFVANLPVGIGVIAGTLRHMPEPALLAGDRRIDAWGAMLAVGMLLCWHAALVLAPQVGRVPMACGLACIGMALAWLWIRSQRREGAMLDLALFRIPAFAGAAALILLARMTSLGVLAFITLWLQGGVAASPLQVGLRLLPLTGALLLVGLGVGRMQARHSCARLVGCGFCLHALGLSSLAFAEGGGAPTTVGLALLGAGGAIIFPPLLNVAVAAVPAERTGTASGLANACSPLGTALGVAVFGGVFSLHLDATLGSAGLDATTAAGLREAIETGRLGAASSASRSLARASLGQAFSTVCVTAAGVSALGVAVAVRLLPRATPVGAARVSPASAGGARA